MMCAAMFGERVANISGEEMSPDDLLSYIDLSDCRSARLRTRNRAHQSGLMLELTAGRRPAVAGPDRARRSGC